MIPNLASHHNLPRLWEREITDIPDFGIPGPEIDENRPFWGLKTPYNPIFRTPTALFILYIFSNVSVTRNQFSIHLEYQINFRCTWNAKSVWIYLGAKHIFSIPTRVGREICFRYTWDAKHIFGIPVTQNIFSVYLGRKM